MLTREGFSLVITIFFLTFLTSTLIVYPPLTFSAYAIAVFIFSYILIAIKGLKPIKASDFSFNRSISVDYPIPREMFEVKISVTNRSPIGLDVTVIDCFEGLQLVEGLTTVERYIKPNESVELRYAVVPPDRGIYILGPLMVKVSDDYGICCRYITLQKEARIFVRPILMDKPKLMESVRRVQALSVSGSGSSIKYGTDDIFREITKYEDGLPLKNIDWRRMARDDGEIYIRKYDRLNRLQILFLIDCTISNTIGNPSIMDSIISAVAVLSLAMLEKGDVVTVKALGGSEPGTYRVRSSRDFEGLMDFLTRIKPGISFDIIKEAEELNGFDAAFMVGRFAFVDDLQMKALNELVRRRVGVLFIVIPLLKSEGEVERMLTELEMLRIQSLKKCGGFITAVNVHQLVPHISHLHRMLRALT